MLVRYWTWTSGPAGQAESGLPFGPLRYRAWTTGGAVPAEAGLPFGPLRFRAWTSGAAIPPGPVDHGGGGGGVRRPFGGRVSESMRARLAREDEELLLYVVSLAVAADLMG